MAEEVMGVYRLEALGPGTNKAIEIMDIDLDILLEMEDLLVLRLPKEQDFRPDMEDAISAIQSIAGSKKWLVVDHDVELMRVVKVA
jgi:hypothetical protein